MAPTPQPAPEVTVVVPVRNERDNVGPTIAALTQHLAGFDWEVVFVDDDSPDGTADAVRRSGAADGRVRCLRRIARRGLAGACIEGILSARAEIVLVMDGDLQHDPALAPALIRAVQSGMDVAIGSRYLDGAADDGFSAGRASLSRTATRLALKTTRIATRDPMSGYFCARRDLVDRLAPRLSTVGFKILFDLLATAGPDIRTQDIPYTFGARQHGESKLDNRVALDFLDLLLTKATGGRISLRFVAFALVGLGGLAVHLTLLRLFLGLNLPFSVSQALATVGAMTSNFLVNNVTTYRDRRLTGLAILKGLLIFYAVCGLGAAANVGVGNWVFTETARWWLGGVAGAVVGSVWNYAATRTLVWNRK